MKKAIWFLIISSFLIATSCDNSSPLPSQPRSIETGSPGKYDDVNRPNKPPAAPDSSGTTTPGN